MMKRKHTLKELLTKHWHVPIDQGHKSALKHKLIELEMCEDSDSELEYSGGDWVTKDERVKTQTIIRTDWRPVWAAALILLAVVIIMLPRDSIKGPVDNSSGFMTASPHEIIIKGFDAPNSQLQERIGLKHANNDLRIEKRFIYMIGDLTHESKVPLTMDQLATIFQKLGGENINSAEIQFLEVMVPENYYLETREGEVIYYCLTPDK